MFAQVIQAGVRTADRAELVRIVRENLVPALEREAGFGGALGMVEAGTGRAMMIALWELEEQASAPPKLRGESFRQALADVERLSDSDRGPVSVWVVEIEL